MFKAVAFDRPADLLARVCTAGFVFQSYSRRAWVEAIWWRFIHRPGITGMLYLQGRKYTVAAIQSDRHLFRFNDCAYCLFAKLNLLGLVEALQGAH